MSGLGGVGGVLGCLGAEMQCNLQLLTAKRRQAQIGRGWWVMLRYRATVSGLFHRSIKGYSLNGRPKLDCERVRGVVNERSRVREC